MFSENEKGTVIISDWGLQYLTDPIHSTKRYSNHDGCCDIVCFPGPARGLLEGPGSIRITSSSGYHQGNIPESNGKYPGSECWLGWQGWLGGAEFFISSLQTEAGPRAKVSWRGGRWVGE